MLAVIIGGMAFLTVLVGWLIHRATRNMRLPSAQNGWLRVSSISIVCILLLTIYPENWRESGPGAIFTVFVGAAFLFVLVRAIGIAISPFPGMFFEDFIDDVTVIYRWLKAHVGPFVVFFTLFEKILAWPFIRSVLNWLNPRKHSWNLVILIGIFMGILVALGEMLGEGGGSPQIGLLVKVVAIFIGIECLAVLLGYLLLAKPLDLFRQTADETGQVMEKI